MKNYTIEGSHLLHLSKWPGSQYSLLCVKCIFSSSIDRCLGSLSKKSKNLKEKFIDRTTFTCYTTTTEQPIAQIFKKLRKGQKNK